jgi:hypothetical protein
MLQQAFQCYLRHLNACSFVIAENIRRNRFSAMRKDDRFGRVKRLKTAFL